MVRASRFSVFAFAAVAAAVALTGCDGGLRNYVRKGFKVGPNYCQPDAPVAEHWIDEKDIHAEENPEVLRHWWTVFNDPKLNELIHTAHRQNLSLREAGFRVLEARYSLAIAVGELFPQSQTASGSYFRNAAAVAPNSTGTTLGRYTDSWDFGFNLNWELDFWGRFRRAIAAADDNLEASVYNYDYVLVTLLGDVAANYVTIRTTQERIRLLEENAKLQRGVLKFISERWKAGYKQTELDLDQALSNLRQTEAAIPQLEITRQQAENALCVLLGIPTVDLRKLLGDGPIPKTPADAVFGIPADLLRRRPDVRQAERVAAAQAEQIGIAKSDLYPAFYINGSLGYTAANFPDLFRNTAFNGSVGPSFQWNILNYGRIANNVRFQNATFQELVTTYQKTVLNANAEVENGMATYLRSQERSKLLDESVTAAEKAVKIVIAQYQLGAVDFNRYATIEQNLVTQQDLAAQARGQIATGMIAVYRALGGGWEIENDQTAGGTIGAEAVLPQVEPMERLPAPLPEAPPAPVPMEKSDPPAAPAKEKKSAAEKAASAPQASGADVEKTPD